jgi:CMP-N,N'-diacetyllegionaminic acid synthase
VSSTLLLIPARAGSKGIPGKNIKLLGGKPLIQYTVETARAIATDDNICISTDDLSIVNVLKALGYNVPFVRPAHLASDLSGSYEVILHALEFYEKQGRTFEKLILLQPTSPFRTAKQVTEALALYTPSIEMVVSVKETRANPYYLLMEENADGWLEKVKSATFNRRQDVPVVYELNGAIYVINVEKLNRQPISSFRFIRKYVMDELCSLDIDTPIDWVLAEALLEKDVQKWLK